jgi:hypothetical protein
MDARAMFAEFVYQIATISIGQKSLLPFASVERSVDAFR